MNLRPLFLRAALVVALFGFAGIAATLTPRLTPDDRITSTHSLPLVFFPLVALPLVHALLPP